MTIPYELAACSALMLAFVTVFHAVTCIIEIRSIRRMEDCWISADDCEGD